MTEATIVESLKAYGTITRCQMAVDHKTGASQGFAFVTFEKPEGAKDAIAFLKCRGLKAKFAEHKSDYAPL